MLLETFIELAAERAARQETQEYKKSVNGCLAALIQDNPSLDHEWSGDRTGWGFVFEWIKWVAGRAIKAENDLLETQAIARELQADKERLDWLQSNHNSLFCIHTQHWQVHTGFRALDYPETTTAREAIDCAKAKAVLPQKAELK